MNKCYEAFDGKMFDSKNECEKHDYKMKDKIIFAYNENLERIDFCNFQETRCVYIPKIFYPDYAKASLVNGVTPPEGPGEWYFNDFKKQWEPLATHILFLEAQLAHTKVIMRQMRGE